MALIVFDKTGLNQPAKAKDVVRVIAADENNAQTYLLLVQYATAAGDKRTAQLAAQKAVDLAPEGAAEAGRKDRRATANCRPATAVRAPLAYPSLLQSWLRCNGLHQGEE